LSLALEGENKSLMSSRVMAESFKAVPKTAPSMKDDERAKHEFRGKRSLKAHKSENAEALNFKAVAPEDKIIWIFYAPGETIDAEEVPVYQAKTIYAEKKPVYQPVGLTAEASYVQSMQTDKLESLRRDADNHRQALQAYAKKLEGTLNTRWVWFFRHCFSCSNERRKRDGIRQTFKTLGKNFLRFIALRWRSFGSWRQNEFTRSKMINPFCERQFLADTYVMGRLIAQRTTLCKPPFFIYSSQLARAMQTALLLGEGLKSVEQSVSGTLKLLPYIMEESNSSERRKIGIARSATQNVTNSQNACADEAYLLRYLEKARIQTRPEIENKILEDIPDKPILGDACKKLSADGIAVVHLARKQALFFESQSFRGLPLEASGTSVVVTHGGFLRKLLLQGVRYAGRMRNKNPHPRNAEGFLCEILSLEVNGNEEVKAIFVRDQVDPSDESAQKRRDEVDTSEINSRYDAGNRCETIGSGSCEFWNDARCLARYEPQKLRSSPQESDLIAQEERAILDRSQAPMGSRSLFPDEAPVAEIFSQSAAPSFRNATPRDLSDISLNSTEAAVASSK
jgi:broad specificity phosphatase PhoE